MTSPFPFLDALLVKQCLAGDEPAWQRLRDRHDEALRRWVQQQLATRPRPGIRCEDITDAVWAALYLDDGRLLRAYDAAHAPFPAYLHVCANAPAGRSVYDQMRDDE